MKTSVALLRFRWPTSSGLCGRYCRNRQEYKQEAYLCRRKPKSKKVLDLLSGCIRLYRIKNSRNVSVHRAPHLLCCQVFEVQ